MRPMRFGVLVILLLLASCSSELKPPKRTPGIPQSAVWAGGVDGGSWIQCSRDSLRPGYFSCQIFNDFTGFLEASGTFVLRRMHFETKSDRPSYTKLDSLPQFAFVAYNGVEIELKDSLILLPDGWIDYPFGEGHGKRQLFSEGKERSEAIQY